MRCYRQLLLLCAPHLHKVGLTPTLCKWREANVLDLWMYCMDTYTDKWTDGKIVSLDQTWTGKNTGWTTENLNNLWASLPNVLRPKAQRRGAFGAQANLNQVLSWLEVQSEGPLQPTHSHYEYLEGLGWMLLLKGKLCGEAILLCYRARVSVCVCFSTDLCCFNESL